jgi:hypothetical protein
MANLLSSLPLLKTRFLMRNRAEEAKMLLQSDSVTNKVRKVRGRAPRSQSIGTKLTKQEESEVITAAERQGKAPGEWARDVLLATARDRLPSDDSALFVEIQALRLLLVNALEPLLRGDKMNAEQFKEMLRYVRASKRKAAEDMLASYAERSTEQL